MTRLTGTFACSKKKPRQYGHGQENGIGWESRGGSPWAGLFSRICGLKVWFPVSAVDVLIRKTLSISNVLPRLAAALSFGNSGKLRGTACPPPSLSSIHTLSTGKQAKPASTLERHGSWSPPHLPWLARDGSVPTSHPRPNHPWAEAYREPAPSTRPAGGSSYACESCMKCLGRLVGGCRGWIRVLL